MASKNIVPVLLITKASTDMDGTLSDNLLGQSRIIESDHFS